MKVFERLLIISVVNHNNFTLLKRFWGKILSNEILGCEILMSLVILGCLSDLWKVFYDKFNQGNYQKTDVGVKRKDIYKKPKIPSGHT